jgi:hypothetical protein
MRNLLDHAKRSLGSLPRFLALPLGLPWLVLGAFFWICAGVWVLARFATQQVQRGWGALRGRAS